MFDNIKILIISHNPLSNITNMGKTIASFVADFPKNNVAQLYLHDGKPNYDNCSSYYSFNDKDALKSIFNKKIKGNIIKPSAIDNRDNKIQKCPESAFYTLGRKRHPFICLLRDVIWKFSNILNKQLFAWIKNFNPNVIFYAAGDYCFSYRISMRIHERCNIPLVSYFCDDFFFSYLKEKEFLGKTYHKKLLKDAKKLVSLSSTCFAIGEEMALDYSRLFGKDFQVLFTSFNKTFPIIPLEKKSGISYLGGLGLDRHKQLIEIANALQSLNNNNISNCIDVYTRETNTSIIEQMEKCDGIKLHSPVCSDDVIKIIAKSKYVIHTESFEKTISQRTKYSISTKIAESLASHTALIAYGPKDVSSIKYLKDNEAAIVSDNIDELIKLLLIAENDNNFYNQIVSNAYSLYLRNHTQKVVSEIFEKELQNVLSINSNID